MSSLLADSCLPAMHRGCVLVVAVVMVCDSGKRDRQGSGGEGREHVGESRRMKDWGSGRRGHVVVVVSVWSWLSVLYRTTQWLCKSIGAGCSFLGQEASLNHAFGDCCC